MPKGSEALTNARREEIVNACASLYETQGFKEITLRDIGARTSFTRTSIYNYFQAKEEIFLALLQREHEAWTADLEELAGRQGPLSPEAFADQLARTLEKRECMLKLESMNLYDIEGCTRMEHLVAFKRVYAGAVEAVGRCLERFFPALTAGERQEFLYAFFPFLFGVYPYAVPTEKQREAMELAHVDYAHASIYELSKTFVTRLLRAFPQTGGEGAPVPPEQESGQPV